MLAYIPAPWILGDCQSTIFPRFSHGFPMVFLWFSYGFPMVFDSMVRPLSRALPISGCPTSRHACHASSRGAGRGVAGRLRGNSCGETMGHWIGLRENLQETMVFTIKYRAFCKFSHHPILWMGEFQQKHWMIRVMTNGKINGSCFFTITKLQHITTYYNHCYLFWFSVNRDMKWW